MIALDFGFGAVEAERWKLVFLMTRIGAAPWRQTGLPMPVAVFRASFTRPVLPMFLVVSMAVCLAASFMALAATGETGCECSTTASGPPRRTRPQPYPWLWAQWLLYSL